MLLDYVLFAVPDLETVPFRVLKREAEYEIREGEVRASPRVF